MTPRRPHVVDLEWDTRTTSAMSRRTSTPDSFKISLKAEIGSPSATIKGTRLSTGFLSGERQPVFSSPWSFENPLGTTPASGDRLRDGCRPM
jgi:hypothetical protein